MKKYLFALLCCSILYTTLWGQDESANIQIKIATDESQGILDGRLIFVLTPNKTPEPRFQVLDSYNTAQVFGMDVEEWNTAEPLIFDNDVFGYPIENLANVPPGNYYLQAIFHKYETFQRADGHTVKLPMDRGEGQQWNRAPGNIYSEVLPFKFDPNRLATINIPLELEIPEIEPAEDTEWIKHVRIKSERLSEFWGRDMYLGAHILLPKGYDDHPDVKYPLAIMHGHYPHDFGGFRVEEPDPNLKPDYSSRFQVRGYNRIIQREAHQFYKIWTDHRFPRVLAIKIQHPTPFYDDSYAVNSANQGPYGDAITYELIPYIEENFRGIGEGWARFVYGGSTGGWEAMAAQVMYPDEYNGAFVACPDPIDFRAYTSVNIYEEDNAYYREGTFRKTLREGHRNYLGQIDATLKDMCHRELALGTNGRSGQQWDVWEATYSPVDSDGYPKPLWDKMTGVIDKEVADYWKENYDLSHILKRDWNKHGESWTGKFKIYCGDMDNYYLNNAVYYAEDVLESLQNPSWNGEVDYGDGEEHCWNGDHENPNHISRLRYHTMFITKWVDEIRMRAPEGADLISWRYE